MNIGQHLTSAHKISLKEYFYTYIKPYKDQSVPASIPNHLAAKSQSKKYSYTNYRTRSIINRSMILTAVNNAAGTVSTSSSWQKPLKLIFPIHNRPAI